MNSLNNIRNSVESQGFDKMISPSAAGFDDGLFTASVSELKALYLKKENYHQFILLIQNQLKK